jgi:hypothetical protein
LRVGWLDMFSGAAVAVSAGADFVVEGAVDFVLFGSEDGGEIIGHVDGWRVEEKEVVVWCAGFCMRF